RGNRAGLVQSPRRRASWGVLAQPDVRPRDRGRTALRIAARRHLDACRHARRDQGRRSRHPGQRGLTHFFIRKNTREPRIQPLDGCMSRVFTIPASQPFLPTLITALIEGRLIEGYRPGRDTLALASATLYLPTRRACRLARDVFLDVLE